MTEHARGSVAQALLSGAVVLGTGPVALALLIMLARTGDDGGAGALARLVQEGGMFSYVILLTGGVASLAGAVLLGLSVRRPGLAPSFALVPFLLPLAVAALGTGTSMREMLQAIAHANPLDQPVILIAGTGEVASLPIQALALGAGGALTIAVGALLGLLAPGRGPRVVTALASLALAGALFASAFQLAEVRAVFTALANVSPADRAVLFASAIDTTVRFSTVGNGLLLAAVVVAGVGAAVLKGPGVRAQAIGTAVGVLVAVVGLRGLDALVNKRLFSGADELPPTGPARVRISGIAPRSFSVVSLDDVGQLDERIARQVAGTREQAVVGFDVLPGSRREALLKALGTAHYLKAEVDLVGSSPERNVEELPKQFRGIARLLFDQPLAVPLKVVFTEEPCERCKRAKLDGDALKVDDDVWTAKSQGPVFDLERYDQVELEWTDGTPESLARAASIALANEHVLTVRIPTPETPPTLPDL